MAPLVLELGKCNLALEIPRLRGIEPAQHRPEHLDVPAWRECGELVALCDKALWHIFDAFRSPDLVAALEFDQEMAAEVFRARWLGCAAHLAARRFVGQTRSTRKAKGALILDNRLIGIPTTAEDTERGDLPRALADELRLQAREILAKTADQQSAAALLRQLLTRLGLLQVAATQLLLHKRSILLFVRAWPAGLLLLTILRQQRFDCALNLSGVCWERVHILLERACEGHFLDSLQIDGGVLLVVEYPHLPLLFVVCGLGP